MTRAFTGIVAEVAANQGTAAQDCAVLLEQVEATATAYLAALATALQAPDLVVRQATLAQAQPLGGAWRQATAALLSAVHQCDMRSP
jgi:hypothetical protein